MTLWTSGRAASALGTAPVAERVFTSVSTDTRTIEPGSLFVALVGDRFDGHDFVGEAVARGATGIVVQRSIAVTEEIVVFQVPDTLTALGSLGLARRQTIPGHVVAVTGTNGKTATKELLAKTLGTRWCVHATHGPEQLDWCAADAVVSA